MVRLIKRLIAGLLILVLIIAIPIVFIFIGLSRDVQNEMGTIEDRLVVADSNPTVIVAADGSELLKISELYRKPFTIDDVPDVVQDAFVAAEDRRFWTHSGVDGIGLLRAAFVSAKDRRASQGGSTITMQIAKRLVNGDDKTPERKARDIVLAMELEKRKTKRQLLELYLKMAYFGEGAFGLGSAAEVYFGKEINELTLSEAAMLARCVRRPSDQNPEVNYRKAIQNRDVVLSLMREEGMITAGQFKDAQRERPQIRTTRYKAAMSRSRAPYFVDHVLAEIRRDFPDIDLKKGGYRVETTLMPDIQAIADKEVHRVVAENKKDGVNAGAFILIDRNGGVLAEVGGQDYKTQQFNVATSGERQPGSSFKPIVYATALDKGVIRPDQMISNAPISIDQGPGESPWRPSNGNRQQTASSYSVATSIANSINLPALHVYFDTGMDVVVDYAHKVFGLKQNIPVVRSLPLGVISASPLQMAEVYSVFALGGDRVEPSPIKRIIAPDGTLVKDYQPKISRNVLNRNVAAMMDGFLRGVVTNGTGYKANVVPEARGKTGTTNEHRDAWFCGYSNGLVAVAWVGNVKNNQPMSKRVNGGVVSVQFWASVMSYAVPKYGSAATSDTVMVETSRVGSQRKAPDVAKPDEAVPDPDAPVGPDEDPGYGDPIIPDGGDPASGGGQPSADPSANPGQTPPPGPGTGNETEKMPAAPVETVTNKMPEPKGSTKTKTNSDKPPEPKRGESMVEVELCADSGDLAGRYCPSTVTRSFAKSRVPKRVCKEHSG